MKPFYEEDGVTIWHGNCRSLPLPDESVSCCVTSPPYWGLRDYGTAIWEGGEASCDHKNRHSLPGSTTARQGRTFTGSQNFYRDECLKCGAFRVDSQIGLESTPEEYVNGLVEAFREVRRVLRDDGTLWLNLGDSYSNDTKWGGTSGGKNYTSAAGGYQGQRVRRGKDCDPKRGPAAPGQPMQQGNAGLKPKDLVGIPWRAAFALQADGWYLRSDIIWHKPNPMPESVTDRPTKAHEYLFLLAKSEKYYYDAAAIAEPVAASQVGRVRSDVIGGASWEGRGQHSKGGTYATTRLRGALSGVQAVDSGCSLEEQQVQAGVRETSEPGAQAVLLGEWLPDPSAPPETQGRTGPRGGKHSVTEPQAASRRMIESVALARARGGSHDSPHGGMRNKRSVWTVNTQPYPEAHFATFPEDLIKPCILGGSPPGGLVLDPFGGSGTTVKVARFLGRRGVMVELNEQYCELARKRLSQSVLHLQEEAG